MTQMIKARLLDRSTPPHIMTLVLLAGISAMSNAIFLPSLNGMTTYFNTTYSIMQWSVSGYFAGTAVLQLFFGPLSDRFGRRPILLITIALFTVASVGAALATTVEVFLFCRIAQAAIASCMALSRAVVRDVYPTSEAASMIGYVTMGMSIVPMIGPMLGGALDQAFGWQASFWMLAATGLIVWLLTYFDLPETYRGGNSKFIEQVKTYPELFRSPRFWGYVACTSFTAGGFYSLLGAASYVSSVVFHLSAAQTGIAIGAPALGYAYGNYLSGKYAVRYGIDKLTLLGCIVTFVCMSTSFGLSVLNANNVYIFFGLCAIMGVGNGLTMPNATTGALSVRPHLAGTAAGLSSFFLLGGAALLSGLAGSILNPEWRELPVSSIMVICSILALVSILLVARRNRFLGEAL